MTPTDEIRKKLDELGISWFAIAETATEYAQEGIVYRAYEVFGGLQVAIVTPVTTEQVIAATVGAGTCRCTVETSNDYYDDYTRYHMSCGFTMYSDDIDKPRFCAGCGRRIEVSE